MTGKTISYLSQSDAETHACAAEVAANIKPPALVCLYGELGAGKTTFVRGLARALGIKSRIQSPTFTYERIHEGPSVRLYHFDCYRITGVDLLLEQDLAEALKDPRAVVAVEWAERVLETLPVERIEVHCALNKDDPDEKKSEAHIITITYPT